MPHSKFYFHLDPHEDFTDENWSRNQNVVLGNEIEVLDANDELWTTLFLVAQSEIIVKLN